MTSHRISRKVRVVIPAELRKKYGLEPGTEVHIVDYGGVLAIFPAMREPVEQAAGMLKGGKRMIDSLLNEHRQEGWQRVA